MGQIAERSWPPVAVHFAPDHGGGDEEGDSKCYPRLWQVRWRVLFFGKYTLTLSFIFSSCFFDLGIGRYLDSSQFVSGIRYDEPPWEHSVDEIEKLPFPTLPTFQVANTHCTHLV